MLLARNFSSDKSVNNAVTHLSNLLDLRGAGGAVWGTMDKGRAWTHHHLGQETWLLKRFHGEKDRKKMWFQEKIEKHSACIVCSEKMAMECRQVGMLEHEAERWTCIVCSEKMAMDCMQVSTLENEGERWNCVLCAVRKWQWIAGTWARWSTTLNDETRRLGQSAKRSDAVRGQAGRGATVAGRRRPGAAEPIVRIFCLLGFVADRGSICFSSGSRPHFFPHVRNQSIIGMQTCYWMQYTKH
jgi:hypothetical protein